MKKEPFTRFRRATRNWNALDWSILIALFVTLALLGLCTTRLKAQGHNDVRGFHNEHHHGRLHDWYQKLMRPDVPHMSCCNRHDCTPTQAKRVDGKWMALKAGRWITIPDAKINSEESVDSQAHICWYPSTAATDDVLCFVKPGSGI